MKEIQLTKGFVALVDDEDYESLMTHARHVSFSRGGRPYACRSVWNPATKKKEHQSMSRLILGVSGEIEVDHANHETLDNRRANIRPCTRSQNMANSGKRKSNARDASLPKGVVYVAGLTRPYRALIKRDKKSEHLGYFHTVDSAATAYAKRAKELFGEFACCTL